MEYFIKKNNFLYSSTEYNGLFEKNTIVISSLIWILFNFILKNLFYVLKFFARCCYVKTRGIQNLQGKNIPEIVKIKKKNYEIL